MDLTPSEAYEEPALAWLSREAARLNAALVAAGVQEEDVRQAVCEDFIFGLSYGLDEEAVEIEQTRYAPALIFMTDDAALTAAETFAFHEYTHGLVGELFGAL